VRRLFGSGDADEVAFGVGDLADDELSRGALGAHLALPPEALGFLECGLDVGNADVEQDAPLVVVAAADAAVDLGVAYDP
jgi:hypothetical protein